jgi:hypothetical protein
MNLQSIKAPFAGNRQRVRFLTIACIALGLPLVPLHAQGNQERPDVAITTEAAAEAVGNLARETEVNYPVIETGNKVAKELRQGLRSGRYKQTSAKKLAALLTEDLRRLSGDPHMMVDYFVVPRAFPAANSSVDPVSDADRQLTVRLQNFGFARVERLAGNVGYIKLDRFEDPAVASPLAAAAMQLLAGTDALIIDLRTNGGGHGGMGTLLSSYFFPEPVHLSDRIGRGPADLRQYWTYAVVPGPRYLDKPVFILSGPRTFSAAEGFAYNLQGVKRARIVGEKTRGGANMVARLLLSSRFGVIMPVARVKNSVTDANWEGGLEPDISTSAALALSAAHLAALEAIAPNHRNDPLTAEIEKGIASLRSELATVRTQQ